MNDKALAVMGFGGMERVIKIAGLMLAVVMLAMPVVSQAQVNRVTTVQDENGWRLQVDGEDYYIKGVVWGYTPRGENYTYNLWDKGDDHIRKVLDYDFGLMKAAGINTIRSFAMIPPKWVTYIYREHGIMSVINPLMGRYGYTIGGRWVPFTDYSDPLTRATLLKDSLEIVDTYKDVPGVIMFAFGNESNYGLSWSSFEIENLPEGEQNTAKARFLYSLFEEVVKGGKEIAPNHPFSIVNGDIQYIDLIAELVPSLDILGSNVYRGRTFTSLWAEVDEKLDLPVVFFEFGSDAYNARELQEDQAAQAGILKDQWQEMYNKSWGNGEEGNAIGGFVFEWRDEWWKYLQEENLDTQDNNASWSNQAYLFDWAPGKNNMNEEWFGITALGPQNSNGVYTARPRTAYDVLAEVFAMDPYQLKKSAMNQNINDINMDYLNLKGEVRLLKEDKREDDAAFSLTGGQLRTQFVSKGTEQDTRIDGENGVEFESGQMVFLDFGFKPNDRLEGQVSVNILGRVADVEPLEIQYGRRGLPVVVRTEDDAGQIIDTNVVGTQVFNDRERVEIYDFEATYKGDNFDVTAFYHTPRFHYMYKGDFYGLIHEATDIDGIDIWNGKAPEGIEFVGKGKFDGLTVIAGPEIYWGANPKTVIKYDFETGPIDWTFIHSEDIARLGQATGAAGATVRQSRQTTIYAKTNIAEGVKLEVGGIISAPERIDEIYDRVDSNSNIFVDQIEFEDTLGVKAKLTFPFLGTLSYVRGEYAGLVAESGIALREFGTQLPYSGLGNKQEFEAGSMINIGNLMIFPRVLYRDNLVHANPIIASSVSPGGILNPGILPRDRDNDPFAVLDNREARAAELFITYDPTGATPFYQWDNDWREDAGFAFNLGMNYTSFPTATDANLFFFPEESINASFGRGLPAEDVWTVSSRMVFNPNPRSRYITRFIRGFNQSTGDPNGGTRDYWEAHGKAVWNGKHVLQGYFKKDAWGPYDFHRQFNITFPEQYSLDYSMLLDQGLDERFATKIGIRGLLRTNDENSPDDEFLDGDNDYIFQVIAYFTLNF
ncbi:MAG: hypothetical protein AAAFM81_00360 [Pseudomonadota bacterium]